MKVNKKKTKCSPSACLTTVGAFGNTVELAQPTSQGRGNCVLFWMDVGEPSTVVSFTEKALMKEKMLLSTEYLKHTSESRGNSVSGFPSQVFRYHLLLKCH